MTSDTRPAADRLLEFLERLPATETSRPPVLSVHGLGHGVGVAGRSRAAVGHSMGGLVVQQAAATAAARLDCLFHELEPARSTPAAATAG